MKWEWIFPRRSKKRSTFNSAIIYLLFVRSFVRYDLLLIEYTDERGWGEWMNKWMDLMSYRYELWAMSYTPMRGDWSGGQRWCEKCEDTASRNLYVATFGLKLCAVPYDTYSLVVYACRYFWRHFVLSFKPFAVGWQDDLGGRFQSSRLAMSYVCVWHVSAPKMTLSLNSGYTKIIRDIFC